MKEMLFIINPRSGREQFKPHALTVLNTFSAAGYMVTTYVTQKSRDAYAVARAMGGRYEVVACTGGDGTLDEVISGIADGGHNCRIGYIPAGSTNDFASSLNIPADMEKAAQIITEDTVFDCDLGAFNRQHFVYVAAFGIFTEVSYRTDQGLKNIFGHMAYILEGAKEVFDIRPYTMTITIGDQMLTGDFLYGMVCNSLSVGGIKNLAGKEVELDDGLFEVLLIRKPETPLDWQQILMALSAGKTDDKFVYYYKTREILFESADEVPWTMDGEDGGKHTTALIINHPRKLHMLVSPEE